MTNTPRFGSIVQGCRHFLIATIMVAVVGAGAFGIAQAQQNTAYGTNALPGNTGSNNSAFGYGALFLNTSGIDNTGVGVNALGSNTSGQANTGIGYNAMPNSSVPGENTALGAYTLFDNFDGVLNTAVGAQALYSNSSGYDNVAVGFQSLGLNTNGYSNTATGNATLYFSTTGYENTADGFNALESNAAGYDNTATGAYALEISNGQQNTADGAYALEANTTGQQNTAMGELALMNNGTGVGNTASGYEALATGANSSYNTTTGFQSLFVTSGYRNDADGAFALFSDTTGYQNTAVGFYALGTDNSGANNIGIGYNAGENVSSGSNDIYIGSNGGALSESNTIRLGTDGLQFSTFISGIDSTPLGGTPAQVFITNDGELGVVSSSARYKRDIRDMGSATDRLMQLHPVAFRYRTDAMQTQEYGLIAEEVAKVYPELIVRGSGGELEGVAYNELPAMLLNEAQKQNRELRTQAEALAKKDAQIAALQRDNTVLLQRVAQIEQNYGAVAHRLDALEHRARDAYPERVATTMR